MREEETRFGVDSTMTELPMMATVIHDFEGEDDEVISARKGEQMLVLEDYGDGWCDCEFGDMAGIFPTAYLDFGGGKRKCTSSKGNAANATKNSESDESSILLAAAAAATQNLNLNEKNGNENQTQNSLQTNSNEPKQKQQEHFGAAAKPIISNEDYAKVCRQADELTAQLSLRDQEIESLRQQLRSNQRQVTESQESNKLLQQQLHAAARDASEIERKVQESLLRERQEMERKVSNLEKTHLFELHKAMESNQQESERMRRRIGELEQQLLKSGASRDANDRQRQAVSDLELMVAKSASEASESQRMLEEVLQNFDTERNAFRTAQARLTAMMAEKDKRASQHIAEERKLRMQAEANARAYQQQASQAEGKIRQLTSQQSSLQQQLEKCQQMLKATVTENEQRKRAMEVQEKALLMQKQRIQQITQLTPPQFSERNASYPQTVKDHRQNSLPLHPVVTPTNANGQANQTPVPGRQPPNPPRMPGPVVQNMPQFPQGNINRAVPPSSAWQATPMASNSNGTRPIAPQLPPAALTPPMQAISPQEVAYWQRLYQQQAEDPFAGLQ